MPKKHNLPDGVARLATTGKETAQRLTPLEHVLHSLDTNDTPFVALNTINQTISVYPTGRWMN